MSPNIHPRLRVLALTLICWSSFGSVSLGQETRWKFAAGDQFVVTQKQTTDMETVVEKRKSTLGSSVELLGNWKVTSVDSGTALVEQSIAAIKININNPADNTKSVAIDTAKKAKPSKNSRELTKQLQPLIGMVFELKMNDLGEVLSVEVPDETQQLLDAIPVDSWFKALLDPGKLQAQIQNTTLPLPEATLQKGQSVEIEPITNPATVVAAPLGKRRMTYVGQNDIDGRQLEIFLLSTVEKFDAAKAIPPGETQSADQPEVAAFQWDGELQFDRTAGHCVGCQQQTTITTSHSYRDMEMSTNVVVESMFKLQRK